FFALRYILAQPIIRPSTLIKRHPGRRAGIHVSMRSASKVLPRTTLSWILVITDIQVNSFRLKIACRTRFCSCLTAHVLGKTISVHVERPHYTVLGPALQMTDSLLSGARSETRALHFY